MPLESLQTLPSPYADFLPAALTDAAVRQLLADIESLSSRLYSVDPRELSKINGEYGDSNEKLREALVQALLSECGTCSGENEEIQNCPPEHEIDYPYLQKAHQLPYRSNANESLKTTELKVPAYSARAIAKTTIKSFLNEHRNNLKATLYNTLRLRLHMDAHVNQLLDMHFLISTESFVRHILGRIYSESETTLTEWELFALWNEYGCTFPEARLELAPKLQESTILERFRFEYKVG